MFAHIWMWSQINWTPFWHGSSSGGDFHFSKPLLICKNGSRWWQLQRVSSHCISMSRNFTSSSNPSSSTQKGFNDFLENPATAGLVHTNKNVCFGSSIMYCFCSLSDPHGLAHLTVNISVTTLPSWNLQHQTISQHHNFLAEFTDIDRSLCKMWWNPYSSIRI